MEAGPDRQLQMRAYTTVAHTEAWAALESVLPWIGEYFQDERLTMEWAVDGSGSNLEALESIAEIPRLKALELAWAALVRLWRGRLHRRL